MSQDPVKESRVILRRVEAHLRQSHLDMGAQDEAMGFVDVIHHANSSLPSLNYVTPRKNTAWVSSQYIQQGLDTLKDKGRVSRVRFAEGLYPPAFLGSLRELGLKVEAELPIMVYKQGNSPRVMPQIPADVSFSRADSAESLALWWYIWRNAYYDVAVSGVEPLAIGRDLRDVYFKHQINLVMYRHRYPMGVLRMTLHDGSAHLVAHAMLKEMKDANWERLIREVALDAAIQDGADMIFTTGKSEAERRIYRAIGFLDAGSIVSYAEPSSDNPENGKPDDNLTQSVLVV
jgi:hypothetical protein